MKKLMNRDRNAIMQELSPDLFDYGNPIKYSSSVLKQVLNILRFAEAFHLTSKCECGTL